MKSFNYCAPTHYIFGRDAETHVSEMLDKIGVDNVLVVYGQGSVKRSGLLDRVCSNLSDHGVNYTLHGGVQPNPLDGPVYEGIDLVRRRGINGVLAVGGGSVIDTAKAIAAGALYDGDFWDFWAGKAVCTKALPIGVILTIPAAGSEGSGNSVITRTDGMIKISLRTDTAVRPAFALLNPALTMTLPAFQSACGVADMMAHILERYFSNTADVEVTDRLAEGLLRAIIDTATRMMAFPDDYEARANIMWASTLAHNGTCGCGREEDWSSHAIEHELSALYGIAHGAGLAVVFPAWIRFMAEHHPFKPAQLARRLFGVATEDDREAALQCADALQHFFVDVMGLPSDLAGLGIDNPDIPELVKRLHQHKGERVGNYYPLSCSDTTEIYKLML